MQESTIKECAYRVINSKNIDFMKCNSLEDIKKEIRPMFVKGVEDEKVEAVAVKIADILFI